jgi:small subunit ribosomal protein S1
MVDRHLLRDFEVDDSELEKALGASLAELDADETAMDAVYNHTDQTFETNTIVEGTVIRIESDEVLVDIGYKSEGIVQRDEWGEEDVLPEPGEKIEVLLEEFEDALGLILLSKRKADRVR